MQLDRTETTGSSALAELGVSAAAVGRALVVASALLALAAVAGEAIGDQAGWLHLLVDLDEEANLPTWYASGQLALAGVVAFWCGAAVPRRAPSSAADGRAWRLIGAALIAASADEAAQVHEHVSARVREVIGGDGVLANAAWVVPYGVAVAVLAVVLWPFWLRLPPTTRRAFGWCAVVFVAGSLGIEVVEGALRSARGDDADIWALAWSQEVIELVTVALFVGAQLRFLDELTVRQVTA